MSGQKYNKKGHRLPLSRINDGVFDKRFQSAIWIVTPEIEYKLNTFANDFYRAMLDIQRTDCLPLSTIYDQVDKGPLTNTLKKRQLGWLGHALRRRNDEATKRLALYEPEPRDGRAQRGAFALSYLKQINRLKLQLRHAACWLSSVRVRCSSLQIFAKAWLVALSRLPLFRSV